MKSSERVIPITEDGRRNIRVLRLELALGDDTAYIDWEPSGELYYIKVPVEYRRQGLATRLWESAQVVARESGLPPLTHSEYRTNDGDAWAQAVGGVLPSRINA
jgi:ribosomal protein S18 acetylase RimI-like enzyme